jgi:hypothetical protein
LPAYSVALLGARRRGQRDTTVAREPHANQELGRAPIAEQASQAFIDNYLIQAAYRHYGGPAFTREIQNETFVSAQRAQHSQAAASLAQMAARQMSGGHEQLVRERQDLSREWLALEKSLLY